MKKSILLASFVCAAVSVKAEGPLQAPKDTTVVSAATPAATEEGKFTFSGYMDTYYIGNFNNPASGLNLGYSGSTSEGEPVFGNARAFDQRAGTFGIGLVQAKATYSSAKVDAVMDLAFGPNADLGNYGNNFGPLGPGSTALAIKQAYVTLKATERLSFTAGQFGTHIGYEVIDAPVNYNYSLSNLFNNGPFYHIGLKAQYTFSDKAYLMVGVVNNVDALYDNNRAKGIIGQLFVSPASGWNVYLNAITSNENPRAANGSTPDGSYNLYDLTTTYQLTSKFFLGLNAAYGNQGAPDASGGVVSRDWGGVALYSNYAFTDAFGIGARYEVFDNTSAVRGLLAADGSGATVNSITVTGNIITGGGHVLLKPELRIDSYSKDKFETSEANKLTKSQTTLGMAAIFKF